jgi:hypothetical protein
MSLQSNLNSLNQEFCNPCTNHWKMNMFLFLALMTLIGFSVHGWLCIQNIIQDDKKFCVISFNIAILLELAFIIFWLIPFLLGMILNCIYPVNPEETSVRGTRARAPRLEVARIRISYNNLHTIHEVSPRRSRTRSPARSPARRLSV